MCNVIELSLEWTKWNEIHFKHQKRPHNCIECVKWLNSICYTILMNISVSFPFFPCVRTFKMRSTGVFFLVILFFAEKFSQIYSLTKFILSLIIFCILSISPFAFESDNSRLMPCWETKNTWIENGWCCFQHLSITFFFFIHCGTVFVYLTMHSNYLRILISMMTASEINAHKNAWYTILQL